MSNDRSKRISTSMSEMLSGVSNTSTEQCIFKVHDRLRSNNKEAYEPQVLSIGPYHHGERHLKKMETYKLRYLQKLLDRRGESSAYKYIIAVMKLEDRARRCYAEEISLSREDDFVKMLCLDGLFIIEFLRKVITVELLEYKIFQMDWLINAIMRDLILFENQIPFFILDELFEMTKFPSQQDNLIDLARPLCSLLSDFELSGSYTSISANEVIHLLDLVHKIWCFSFDVRLCAIDDPVIPLEFIKSARELQQSGIKFKSAKQHGSWLHITFENGEIKIPHLTVDDNTECIFRNLIAFEQYMTSSQSLKFVADYAKFLDHLIDSPMDVEKLRHHQIITNRLGDDEVVAIMFNKIIRDVSVDDKKFCYSRVYKEVNKHARESWNIWKAHLMRNYFSTPWSIISFLAAVVLLILTTVQTIFSILAVSNGK